MFMKLAFTASETPLAQVAKLELQKKYGTIDCADADCIVALGGDGLVLKTLYGTMFRNKPVYAMRRTESVGFLCNSFDIDNLYERIQAAQKVALHPLRADYLAADGSHTNAVAINEVAIIRESPQSARLRVSVDGVTRLENYSGDGLLVSTPAGSTSYNHSAGGPIIPLEANMLVMTAICGFRPRRWSHALLPQNATIEIEVLEPQKRPVRIEAGLGCGRHIVSAKIWQDPSTSFDLLFDPNQSLNERIVREQFSTYEIG
jgi:NAD+ kinase